MQLILIRKNDVHKYLVRNDNTGKKVVQISLKDYDLPDDPVEMHDITHIERNKNFQGFLNELINKDAEIKTIQKWIKEVVK